MATTKQDFDKNIFINCPFDKEYKPMLRALLFTVVYCGFEPRIASERSDSLEVRLDKIKGLIEESRYSIHDISRMEALDKGELPRFNMPFEIGIDLGCRVFGDGQVSEKRCLILEKERHRYAKALSDLAGVDISAHNLDPEELVSEVREWIRVAIGEKIDSATVIWQSYNEFYDYFDEKMKQEGFSKRDIEKMSPVEFTDFMKEWIGEKKNRVQPESEQERPAFRIIEPKEEYVSGEYVKVSGGGAPPGSAIILVTSLDDKYLAPQEGSVTADRNGNWQHQRCHLLHIGRERLVYALALNIKHEDKVRELLQQKGKSPTDKSMNRFGKVLKAEKIPFQLTPKKRLIRRT